MLASGAAPPDPIAVRLAGARAAGLCSLRSPMSSLWTPGGERPVERTEPAASDAAAPAASSRAAPQSAGGEPTEEELEAELAEVHRQIAETPAWAVIANHIVGMFQLAGVHLGQSPPNLEDARLAIDAMAALVEG